MKPRILTRLGTTPISFKSGRKKPFRLRVSLGGKRIERYFPTRAEAEAEWIKVAPLASHPAPLLAHGTLLSDHESATFLEMRAKLAAVGLSIDDAVQLAIMAKGTIKQESAERVAEPPALSELIHLIYQEIQEIVQRLGRIETGTVMQRRVFRSVKDAARYCGFKNNAAFLSWAERMGFAIPRTKTVQQQRSVFLISELEAAILRDPLVHRNRRLATTGIAKTPLNTNVASSTSA